MKIIKWLLLIASNQLPTKKELSQLFEYCKVVLGRMGLLDEL